VTLFDLNIDSNFLYFSIQLRQ